MIHINRQDRFKILFEDIRTVYLTRGLPCSHYIAGMIMGEQIMHGMSELERSNLSSIVEAARHAK